MKKKERFDIKGTMPLGIGVIVAIFFLFSNSLVAQTYCDSYGNTTYDDGITLVQFNTIDNATAQTKTDGYNDFTGIGTIVNTSETYQLSVNVNTDGTFRNYVLVWIDWN